MHVEQISIGGEDFIGIMGMASDSYSIMSLNFPDSEALSVPMVRTSLYGSNLVGLFCAGNSKGVLLPYFVSEAEAESLRKKLDDVGVDVKVGRVPGVATALGNLISCNDNAAIVSPMLGDVGVIEDILGVPVTVTDISGHDEVGAYCIATNKGFMVHPEAEPQIDALSEIFGVPGGPGSVNFGVPYVKSGLIANSNGYLTGGRTSGIELGKIDEALGFLD